MNGTNWLDAERMVENYQRMEAFVEDIREAVQDRSLSDVRDALNRFDECKHRGIDKESAKFWWVKKRTPMQMDPNFYPGVL